MFNPDHNASPVNPLPIVVVVMVAVLTLVEVVLQLGERGFVGGPQSIGWRVEMMQTFGFFDPAFEYLLESRKPDLSILMRFVTYPIVAGSFVSVLISAVILLALGNAVARFYGPLAMVGAFVFITVFAALAYGLLLDTRFPLIGAMPAVYGFVGLFTRMLWLRARRDGENPWLAFRLFGVLAVLQVGFLLIAGPNPHMVSDFAGFVAGFGLSFLIGPDGRGRRQRWFRTMRQR